ncbi:MAG: hypothetical protein VYB46_03035, partial [Pseudomonadota bacterium]|nr:hypothetical protein [Pseudomonadota bacterium]
ATATPRSVTSLVASILTSRLDFRPVISTLQFHGHDLILVSTKPAAGHVEHLFVDVLEGKIPAYQNPDNVGIRSRLVEVHPLLAAKYSACPFHADPMIKPASASFFVLIQRISQDLYSKIYVLQN